MSTSINYEAESNESKKKKIVMKKYDSTYDIMTRASSAYHFRCHVFNGAAEGVRPLLLKKKRNNVKEQNTNEKL